MFNITSKYTNFKLKKKNYQKNSTIDLKIFVSLLTKKIQQHNLLINYILYDTSPIENESLSIRTAPDRTIPAALLITRVHSTTSRQNCAALFLSSESERFPGEREIEKKK